MANKNDPPKHPEMVKQALQKIFEKGSSAKGPDESHVQHQDRRITDQKPKVDAKLEEKRKEPSKPIVGEHTERIVKERDKDA